MLLVDRDGQDDDDTTPIRRHTTMSEAQIFSTYHIDKADKSPDAELVRLSAAWRRSRNLDDSYEAMHQSTVAVLRANPRLAREYYDQPENYRKRGAQYFTSAAYREALEGDDE